MDLPHTLMRGKENVMSEVHIIMICYNLTRLMTILDQKVLKKLIKHLRYNILGLFSTLRLPRLPPYLKIIHCHQPTPNVSISLSNLGWSLFADSRCMQVKKTLIKKPL